LIPGHGRGRSFAVQKALPAIDGAALSRFERNGGFAPALGTRGHGFRFGEATATGAGPFLFTGFTALRLVLEVLVVEEVLFSRCEDKVCSTVYTFEDAVLKLRHSNVPVIDLNICRMFETAGPWLVPPSRLLDFPAIFLPVSFTGQRLLGPELLARLQVKRVSFDLFNNVLLLDLTLETAKGVL
jgi:hypothetical protein